MSGTSRQLADWLEQAWLQRCLDRELDPEELEWFEAYALDRPHLVAAIEADNRLRDALAAAVPARTIPDVAALPQRMPRRNALIPVAMAAMIVGGAAIGYVLGGGAEDRQSGFMAGPTRIVFDTYRGDIGGPVVHPGAEGTPFILVEVGLPPDATHVVLHAAGVHLPLTVSPDGFASFLLARDAMDETTPRLEFRSGSRELQFEVPIDSATNRELR